MLIPFLCALVLASQEGTPGSAPAQIDWRSRAMPGVDIRFEFEAQNGSWNPPRGGGNIFIRSGTARDLVVAPSADQLLGLRLYTEGQAQLGDLTAHVVFFTVSPRGRCDEWTPMQSLRLPRRMEIPFEQPLGIATQDAAPGSKRELETLHGPRGNRLQEAVRVQETVVPGGESDRGLTVLRRTWEARDKIGVHYSSRPERLLALQEERAFDPRTGVVVRGVTGLSTCRDDGGGRIAWWKTTVREVSVEEHTGPELNELREEVVILHAAWLSARSRPSTALQELKRYEALDHHHLRAAAGAIGNEATEQVSEDRRILDEARSQQATGTEWSALAISTAQAREAIYRGRISATLAAAGLDAGQHEQAFLAQQARLGRSQAALEALELLHASGREHQSYRLRRDDPAGLSAVQLDEAEAWLQTQLSALEREPPSP